MLMDPFRTGGMGSTGGQGFGPPPHPGQLPRFVTSVCICNNFFIKSNSYTAFVGFWWLLIIVKLYHPHQLQLH